MNEELTYSNFYKNSENDQIFYSTNFRPDDNIEYENVLIFNYGLVCSNYHWSKQIPFFIENGFKILVHDYRGHYQSTAKSVDTITFGNITNDLFNICKHLNIKSTYLFGHSMGVNVTLEFAKRFPDMVKKMVLIAGTVMPIDNVMFDTNTMDHLRPILSKLSKRYNNIFSNFWKYAGWSPIMRSAIKRGGFNTELVNDEFIEIYLNKLGQLGPDIFFHMLHEMQKHDILAHLPRINTETLIVGGDDDKVIPNHLQKLLHKQLSNSTLYILKDGSHVPQVDYPDLINDRSLLFIRG